MIVPITTTQGVNSFLNLDNVMTINVLSENVVQFHMSNGEVIYAQMSNPDDWIRDIVNRVNA